MLPASPSPRARRVPAPLAALAAGLALDLHALDPYALDGGASLLGAGTGPDLTRYLTAVAALLVAVAALAWGFRRLIAGSVRARAAQRSLQVIDVLPLGGKRQLSVVRCYDRTFALGLGERDVSLIAELDPVATGKPGIEPEERIERNGDGQEDFGRLVEVAQARLAARRRDVRHGVGGLAP